MPRGQQYPLGVTATFLALVLRCATSLRGAAKVLELLGPLSDSEAAPHWSTGRLWLLRVGLAALELPKEIVDDRVWLVDHSIQIGTTKCLVILGVRPAQWSAGRPLAHEDMELIALEPMASSNKLTVAECLRKAADRTGVPRAILDDHGADLHGGVNLFRGDHPRVDEIYDVKHKVACLLRGHLEADPRWKAFTAELGPTTIRIQQTELAYLVPPSQRSKARFMNIGMLMDWARMALVALDDPSPLRVEAERLRAKLGWLAGFRAEIADWSAAQAIIEATLDFVRCEGLYVGAGQDLTQRLPAASGTAGVLREELIDFVTRQSSQARIGERLPGTTEVLESCFGRLKALEDGQSRSGFTGLVLSLGAMVGRLEPARLGEMLERVRVRDVMAWCREKLGLSIQARRQEAYARAARATELG
ncbi:MAG TPA: hypothetical protein VHS97_02730 [Isosphaeraceae bacterium]|nr:hypothetical protein [Isosphaeraceae bacterium]